MSLIAVSNVEAERWGCPHCGFRSFHNRMSHGGTYDVSCGDCRRGFVILCEGVTKSVIGYGSADGTSHYPELQEHPRKGTPAHGRPDTRPDGGGEFFRPRGVGTDSGPGCFVCGVDSSSPPREWGYLSNIAAFVQHKDAGDRIVRLFGAGAWLDYREREPDRIQVKVSACKEHLPSLEKIFTLTRDDGIITFEKVEKAKQEPRSTS